jgi:hypothetical protein
VVPSRCLVPGLPARIVLALPAAQAAASAAEKVVLARYVLYPRGQQSFGREDVIRLLDEAMERQINFPREVKSAVRRGQVTRAVGETTATG